MTRDNQRIVVEMPLRYLENMDVEKLLAACKNHRDFLLIKTLWKSGCRISELLSLTHEGIDRKRGTIEVPALKLKRKGRKKFPVLDSETLEMLYQFGNGKNRVFPITRQRAWQIVQETGKRAGLTHVSPHVLRHSFACHWAQSGGDLVKLQRQLGHTRLSTTTDQYLHYSTADVAQEYNRVWDST